jgi:hypothetical protein
MSSSEPKQKGDAMKRNLAIAVLLASVGWSAVVSAQTTTVTTTTATSTPASATNPPGVVVIGPPGQALLATDAAQAAPFNPAPLGTTIVTTIDHRVVQRVTGYDVNFEINGKWVPSYALLTEGLGGNAKIYPIRSVEELWPLEVGKSTSFNFDGDSGARAVNVKVTGTQTITVPAGTFYTYVIERRDRLVADGRENVATYWYAPMVGTFVKFQDTRAARPRPSWDMVSVVLPHPLEGTVAITTPGDSPERRAQFCGAHGQTVMLSDGRSLFLTCNTFVQANLLVYRDWLLAQAPAARQ